ncbi:uncharacterized protein LOC130915329 [Corythoichthys intestinalis]|uniref:uncharacterized protein LOC130915329 n=1 Tax=Corythoichthys intestinalis TaxID=161448 RepID=UPI0025A54CC9|nr:uncharacterized protein LOC130915329 [Corythoichthys intestinalis]
MEMKKVGPKKTQFEDEKSGKEPMLEAEGEGNPYAMAGRSPHDKEEEEAGRSDYIGLQKPAEDIYSNISDIGKKAQGAARPYKLACLILSVLCLALLVAVIVLILKSKSASMVCPMQRINLPPETCDMDQCKALTPQDNQRCRCCYKCPSGWVRLNHSCFFFSTFTLSWPESKINCLQQGGFLAVIKSEQDQTSLTYNGNGFKYWIGIGRQENKWKFSDGTLLEQGNKTYWRNANKAGDCVFLKSSDPANSNWMTSNCNFYTYFISKEKNEITEMKKVDSKKTQFKDEKAGEEPMLEAKGEGNPYAMADRGTHDKEEEEAGRSHYIGLQKPAEDIYSNISDIGKKAQGTARPYKLACLILSVLCLALLVAVIALILNSKSASMVCPMNRISLPPETCDMEQCKALTPQDNKRCSCCSKCPSGWVRLNHSCFFFSTFTLSWPESKINCSHQGGFLAVIKSDQDQNFLTQSGNSFKYWIGIGRQGNQWKFSDGTFLQQGNKTYWSNANKAGDCVFLESRNPANSNWMTSDCDLYTYFICQKQI